MKQLISKKKVQKKLSVFRSKNRSLVLLASALVVFVCLVVLLAYQTTSQTHTLSKVISEYPEAPGLKVTFNNIDRSFQDISNTKTSKEEIDEFFILSNGNVVFEIAIAIASDFSIHQAGKFYNHYLQSEIYQSDIVENEKWDDPNFKYRILYSNDGDLNELRCKPPWLYLFPGQELNPSGLLTPCMPMVIGFPHENSIKLIYASCYLKTADNESSEQCRSLAERVSLEIIKSEL